MRGGLYCVSNGLYQALVLDTGEGALVVDAPPSLAGTLGDAIAATIGKPVSHLVYSHSHGDHIGAAAALVGPGTQVIAHEATATLLAGHGDPNRPVPSRTFRRDLTVDVGGRQIELGHRGANHSPDNLFIRFPEQRTLMLVDVVFPGTAPFRRLTGASDVPGFLRAHEQLLDEEFDTFIGGHFTRLGDRGDVEAARDYMGDLVRSTTSALGQVSLAAVARDVAERSSAEGPGAAHPYRVATAFDAQVAALAADQLVARWSDRLEGLAVFAADHVVTMADSLRWDYNVTGGGLPPAI